MNQAYKDRIKASKARLENEIRNSIPTICHHPFDDVVTIINQRCCTSVNRDFARELYDQARAAGKHKP